MTTTVLAYIPSPPQGVWHLGPFPLRAYALCIIVGIIAALVIGDRRWVNRGGEPGVIYDIALWAVPFGLIGGRVYHVMTDWRTYFGPYGVGPAAAFRIWDGGLGIWCGRVRCAGSVDRLSSAGDTAAGVRRCDCTGNRSGTGDRPAGKLFQSGVVRARDHAAVGSGDLRAS